MAILNPQTENKVPPARCRKSMNVHPRPFNPPQTRPPPSSDHVPQPPISNDSDESKKQKSEPDGSDKVSSGSITVPEINRLHIRSSRPLEQAKRPRTDSLSTGSTSPTTSGASSDRKRSAGSDAASKRRRVIDGSDTDSKSDEDAEYQKELARKRVAAELSLVADVARDSVAHEKFKSNPEMRSLLTRIANSDADTVMKNALEWSQQLRRFNGTENPSNGLSVQEQRPKERSPGISPATLDNEHTIVVRDTSTTSDSTVEDVNLGGMVGISEGEMENNAQGMKQNNEDKEIYASEGRINSKGLPWRPNGTKANFCVPCKMRNKWECSQGSPCKECQDAWEDPAHHRWECYYDPQITKFKIPRLPDIYRRKWRSHSQGKKGFDRGLRLSSPPKRKSTTSTDDAPLVDMPTKSLIVTLRSDAFVDSASTSPAPSGLPESAAAISSASTHSSTATTDLSVTTAGHDAVTQASPKIVAPATPISPGASTPHEPDMKNAPARSVSPVEPAKKTDDTSIAPASSMSQRHISNKPVSSVRELTQTMERKLSEYQKVIGNFRGDILRRIASDRIKVLSEKLASPVLQKHLSQEEEIVALFDGDEEMVKANLEDCMNSGNWL